MEPELDSNKGQGRLVSLEAVAKDLGICPRSVRRLVDRGELPPPVRIGGAVRMFKSEVDAYLNRLRQVREQRCAL